MKKKIFPVALKLFLCVTLGAVLTACGRKGDPQPLNKTEYPRQYPAQHPDCAV